MKFEQVLDCLQADGWPIDRLGQSIARTRFLGAQRPFPFLVHSDGYYLNLLCVPYARLPVDPNRARALMDQLLHFNREINMARFSVDGDGDIVLLVDYPLIRLEHSQLRDAVGVLCHYADEYWPRVSPMIDVRR